MGTNMQDMGTNMQNDAMCAKGDATYTGASGAMAGFWTCGGCGRTFKRSPNQHIYAARKRLASRGLGVR
jgi:ribosomal protein L37AE/L43A